MSAISNFRRGLRQKLLIAIFCLPIFFGLGCQPRVDELRVQCAFAIQNALDFVAVQQTTTGGFVTDCWNVNDPNARMEIDVTFTASQILFSLSFCPDSAIARGTCQRAAGYLLSEKSPEGLFNYYGKLTPRPIPADVDDTSTAWASLKRTGQSVPKEVLGKVRANVNAAGVFNTWILNPTYPTNPDPGDLDTVVNLNALLLLGPEGESPDAACKFVVSQAQNEQFRKGSPYYESPMAFCYAFSRTFVDGGVGCLADAAAKVQSIVLSLQKVDGSWGDDLETAHGTITLLNLGYRGEALQRGVRVLLSRQESDGGWARTTVYRGIGVPQRYGARSITTAVCIEALAKYRAHQ